ncbi:ABC transporter permease [Streptococcus caviae]|uniref:ABC transporter permease n=1 Tax=Streptococcus sp. 'caviae' TaxID=1915004 RepID=UPI00094BB6BE|nr:ABC transporter permease [Streptococcus sp. 'caviae']OLN83957.1 ABC transporter permease [Streptococcus sp. 'caviae']
MFYVKLALNNIKQSYKYFAPFFLVSVTTFLFSGITLLILLSPAAKSMGTGTTALGLANTVLSIFAAIMCLYSYNFLLKQRNQEFGLYNILGMNKKQIIWLSSIELTIIYLVTMVLGVILSLVFANFFNLIFINLVHYDQLNFSVNPKAFTINILLFAAIFVLLEVVSAIRIYRSSALNLFSNQSQGEREPKGNIILAFIGILALGYGYYLSVSSVNLSALTGIVRFFKAILAVILGTYLFYISFITWYLKFRRKSKRYFYKPEHFVTTSQMIFRMKQNAVGLANITLLAIMAFVTVFSTAALYTSNENLVQMSYPKNTMIDFYKVTNRKEVQDLVKTKAVEPLKKADKNFHKSFDQYQSVSFAVPYGRLKTLKVKPSFISKNPYEHMDKVGVVEVVTQDDFRKVGNKVKQLAADEVAFYDYNLNKSFQFDTVNWLGQHYKKAASVKSIKNMKIANIGIPAGLLIVSDDSVMAAMTEIYNKSAVSPSNYSYSAYANLSKKEQQVLMDISRKNGGALINQKKGLFADLSTAQSYREEVLKLSGGFLFTGFLLGIAFLLGAALIIYYKQLSEGTQDKRSYTILQEVGMSLKQVKQTINSQIILVFFMPLAIAIMHFIFALPILKQLLLIFGVQGDRLIYTVSALTISGILVIYFIIYKITSRTYYKLIER